MNYWDERYNSGGTSGCGSIGELRCWKWDTIKQHVNPLSEVIDVGCGDLSFWDGKTLPDRYVGLDSSGIIIERNKITHPNNIFFRVASSEPLGIVAPVVFCFDMLFHIMDGDIYWKTIANLCSMSSEYIFIYTWMINPLRKFGILSTNKSEYEYYRDPMKMCGVIESNGFPLVMIRTNKAVDKYGAMFIFRRSQ